MTEGPDTTLSFTEWQDEARRYRADFSVREGQALFNTLYETRPDIADEVRGTQLDPFYTDDVIPAFVLYVWSRWEMDAPDPEPVLEDGNAVRGILVALALSLPIWGLVLWALLS